MALDSVLKNKLQNDQWFVDRPAAWKILNDGIQLISSTKTLTHNLQCLLSNMCAYGLIHWSYEPGSKTNVENTLKGTFSVTDCGSLAKIFCEIANHAFTAPFVCNALPREIKKTGYRIVTKPGICTFKGKPGDASLEGRWCFGNHWVAEVGGVCYDPTFKFQGFSFAAANSVYLGWYAKEIANPQVFTKTLWEADKTVPGSKNVYMRMVPEVSYTFKRTDVRTGREVA